MENKKILEGKKIDNLEATSASETTPVEDEEELVQLNSSPVPTQEQINDANVVSETNESDQPVVGENVDDNSVPPVEDEEQETQDTQNLDSNVQPQTADAEQELVYDDGNVTETPALKTFTQSQVNEMVGNTRTETREKTFRYIYDRYGVNSEEELDEIIGNAQRYDSLREMYDGDKKLWEEQSSQRDAELASVKEQVALMQSGIDSSRYEDAKFILKGKGLEVSVENIKNELATHPEWQKQDINNVLNEKTNPNFVKKGEPQELGNPQEAEPKSKIHVLGNDSEQRTKPENEEDYVLKKMFKV